jgi:hypothetical protein
MLAGAPATPAALTVVYGIQTVVMTAFFTLRSSAAALTAPRAGSEPSKPTTEGPFGVSAEWGGRDQHRPAAAEDDDRRVELVGFGEQRAPDAPAGPHGRGLGIEAGCPRVLDALGCKALGAGLAPFAGLRVPHGDHKRTPARKQ